jgi:hypothetical protein
MSGVRKPSVALVSRPEETQMSTIRTVVARALLVVSLAALVGGGVPARGHAAACSHTDAVFYTTDTARLAQELAKAPSACADYYLSITPTGTGGPRGGAPITAIRAAGPQFHAMTEIRLPLWTPYATANGWFAAGVEVRREMRVAGYDASLGDTWAINEVGEPTNTAMGVAVTKGTGTARHDLRDFVRGLYTGDDNVPSAGLVFAADPLQVTADLSQYTQDLQSWYSDAAFWNDLSGRVRFWAQETYADARSWGVAGSTLSERSAYLNDYFLHGSRLAAAGDGATDAARAFFAQTYTPVANAAFRQAIPDTSTGIGFGYTDIGLPGMQSFLSTETYAMRSSAGGRIGFAVVPRLATATETLAVEDRLATAIQGSENDPNGACGTSGEWCDSAVAGAQFNDAWKSFANTLEGSNVAVHVGAIKVTFATVTGRGATQVVTQPLTVAPPAHTQLRPLVSYTVDTTAAFAGPVEVCAPYDAVAYAGYTPHLFALIAGAWTDVTTSSDIANVCGVAASLGTFAVFAEDPTPPTILPHVEGVLGNDGWYVGDVTITWDVVDAQSVVSMTNGCDTTTITADTAGLTLTCTATSDGGTASADVTVKRDATPPTVSCDPSPSSLWPPNGKLVPVTVAVAVTDATSGAAGFALTGATTTSGDAAADIVGFELGTPATTGQLRADRPDTGDRVYELTYTAQDAAGNAADCAATVTVPHDQRAH